MSELFKAFNTTGVTDKGCKTNMSSMNHNLDLFFAIGASRGKDITNLMSKAFVENQDLAIRNLLHARDIRGGLGERETFKTLLSFVLNDLNKEKVESIISLIPEIGRFDDLKLFFDTRYEKQACMMWLDAIANDNMLAAKWCPVKDKKGAKPLRKFLGLNEANFRKFIVSKRSTVEQKMCSGNWSDIDYSKLPSLASSRYMTAFHRNDEERYQKFKDSLEKGEVTVNSGAVYPYDIIKGLKNSTDNEAVANAQWNALPDYLEGSTEKFLPIVDVSGSMGCRVSGNSNLSCLDVATSLGLYLSERNNSVLKDVFMTFSERPEMVKTEGSLKQRLSQMERSNWGMSTNIQAVFQTLLGVAVEYNVPVEDMPTKLIIVSDMQFNMCMRGDMSVSAFDMMKDSYENSGYKLPEIVFWQVNASQGNVPVTVDQSGTALVSGFSPSIMTSLLKGDLSPENVMLDALMKDRYKI